MIYKTQESISILITSHLDEMNAPMYNLIVDILALTRLFEDSNDILVNSYKKKKEDAYYGIRHCKKTRNHQ